MRAFIHPSGRKDSIAISARIRIAILTVLLSRLTHHEARARLFFYSLGQILSLLTMNYGTSFLQKIRYTKRILSLINGVHSHWLEMIFSRINKTPSLTPFSLSLSSRSLDRTRQLPLTEWERERDSNNGCARVWPAVVCVKRREKRPWRKA